MKINLTTVASFLCALAYLAALVRAEDATDEFLTTATRSSQVSSASVMASALPGKGSVHTSSAMLH